MRQLIGHTAAIAAFTLTILPPCRAQTRARVLSDESSVIRVVGQAEVSAPPDEATFDVGAIDTDRSAKAAMLQASDHINAILARLREDGVQRADIQTTSLSLQPIWRPHPGADNAGNVIDRTKPPDAYEARHELQVRVPASQFDKLGAIFEDAVTAGANDVGGVRFGIRDPNALRTRGLTAAVRDAESKARIMAEAAGIRLGPAVRIDEGSPPVLPLEAGVRSFALAAGPVPPSEVRESATATVEYSIAPSTGQR